jgi:hypothetical protein
MYVVVLLSIWYSLTLLVKQFISSLSKKKSFTNEDECVLMNSLVKQLVSLDKKKTIAMLFQFFLFFSFVFLLISPCPFRLIHPFHAHAARLRVTSSSAI